MKPSNEEPAFRMRRGALSKELFPKMLQFQLEHGNQAVELRRGVDYFCSESSLMVNLHKWAKKHGIRTATTGRNRPGAIVVKFYQADGSELDTKP